MQSKKIVVLDDDPTGTQTVHDIKVYTDWEEDTLRQALGADGRMFFILTNSRSFSRARTTEVHRQIAARLCKVSEELGREFLIISRGDSTLRGHYPLETQVLRDTIESMTDIRFDGEIICPFFPEGNRLTKDDIHYVIDGDNWIPAGMSEFAKDVTFGYSSSNLRDYVEEKTGGVYKAADCTSFSIEELRSGDTAALTDKLMGVTDFGKVIVNATRYSDLQSFVRAFEAAVEAGHHFLLRTAAAFPKVLGEVTERDLLKKSDVVDPADAAGGIVIVGSHVGKTNRQLNELKTLKGTVEFLEFDAESYKKEGGLQRQAEILAALADKEISQGKTAVIYTSRKVLTVDDDTKKSLQLSVDISDAFTSIVARLATKPRFIIAKGGITSSDVATKALRIRCADVMGQIAKGIPVWKSGPESLFPGMPYVIFPGNVGNDDTLLGIVRELL